MSINASFGGSKRINIDFCGEKRFDADLDKITEHVERDYKKLINLPSINGVTLVDDVTLQALGLKHIYYDTTEGWSDKSDAISELGAVYIYSDSFSEVIDGETIAIPAIKIGDGVSSIGQLPFATESKAYYEKLPDKPSINDKQISAGNNSLSDFGIAKASNTEINRLFT